MSSPVSLGAALPRQLSPRVAGYVGASLDACAECGGEGWSFASGVAVQCSRGCALATSAQSRESAFPVPEPMARRMTFDAFDLSGAPSSDAGQLRNLRKGFETVRRWSAAPAGWLVITGGTGSGKTHLSVAAAVALQAAGRRVAFATVADLADSLRRGSFAGWEDDLIRELRDVDLLVLDDLGVERSTQFVDERLYMIFNHRYERGKATVITTNLAVGQLRESRPRLAARMLDYRNTLHIVLDGPDYRANEWLG